MFGIIFYHKNTEKSKKCRKLVPKRGAQGGPRMWFSEILGFLGPPGGHHGSQTSPQDTSDTSKPAFRMLVALFLIVLGFILHRFGVRRGRGRFFFFLTLVRQDLFTLVVLFGPDCCLPWSSQKHTVECKNMATRVSNNPVNQGKQKC